LGVAMYLLMVVLVLTIRLGVPEAAYTQLDYPALVAELVAVGVTILLGVAANYFFDKPFTSSAVLFGLVVFSICFLGVAFINSQWRLQPFFARMSGQTVVACGLLLMAVWVLAAAAVAVATRANFGLSLFVCTMLFLLGLVSDYLFGRYAESSVLARVAYAASPNLQVFWMADALDVKKAIPLSYVCRVGGYAGGYAAALILLAMGLFQRREIS